MKKGKIYILLFLTSVLFIACPTEDSDLIIFYNNSDFNISYCIATGGVYGEGVYPDTTLPLYNYSFVIESGKYKRDEYFVLDKIYDEEHTDTLCVFIFDADTISKYDWDYIRSEYKILQRYDMSLKDFEHLKYTIYYPPTEAMKDIKMYPPYRGSE